MDLKICIEALHKGGSMKGKLMTSAIVGALLISGSAFGSIARQVVLGGQPVFAPLDLTASTATAANGSLWYDDDYNVFYNPAYVNEYKNYLTINKGMEGGWFSSVFDNFAYGVYVNRGQNVGGVTGRNNYGNFIAPGITARTAMIGASASALNTQRPVDFFFGGDTGIKWGLHVGWAYNRNQTGATNPNNGDGEVSNRYWRFDLGAEVMGFEPYFGTTLFSKYESTIRGAEATQDLNEFNLGLRYKYEGWTPYIAYNQTREAGSGVGLARQVQVLHKLWGFGVGHDTKVADGVHVMKNVGFWMDSVNDDTFTAETNRKYTQMILPINFALEAEATSWLVLRAGATYDFFNQTNHDRNNVSDVTNAGDKKVSRAGTTTFRLGSTFKFGKLHVDSAFGQGTAAANPAGETLTGSNFGFDSQTFALVSAAYHW